MKNNKRGRLFFAGLLLPMTCFLLIACNSREKTGQNKVQSAENGQNAEALHVCFFACSEDADSILLKHGDADILIDTGIEEDSGELVNKLQKMQVDDIELMILTHPDKDHIGGVQAVLAAFPVEQVIMTSCDKGSELQDKVNQSMSQTVEKITVINELEKLQYEEMSLVLYPPRNETYDNSNNYSIGVLAEYQGVHFFFAGDAKKKRLEELLDEDIPQVDVYKVAHHGRDNGLSDDMVAHLQPAYAIVTGERAEEKTQKALTACGAKIYSTYENDVFATVNGGILDVR